MSRIGDFDDDNVAAFAVTSPKLGTALANFTHSVYNDGRLPLRVRELARIIIADSNECAVCLNTRDSEGMAAGIDEEFYANAGQWQTWPGYSDAERIAAEFAHRFAVDHTALREDDDFWVRCAEHFSHELVTDLALSCAMWLGMGRVLRTLDIGQSCKLTL